MATNPSPKATGASAIGYWSSHGNRPSAEPSSPAPTHRVSTHVRRIMLPTMAREAHATAPAPVP